MKRSPIGTTRQLAMQIDGAQGTCCNWRSKSWSGLDVDLPSLTVRVTTLNITLNSATAVPKSSHCAGASHSNRDQSTLSRSIVQRDLKRNAVKAHRKFVRSVTTKMPHFCFRPVPSVSNLTLLFFFVFASEHRSLCYPKRNNRKRLSGLLSQVGTSTYWRLDHSSLEPPEELERYGHTQRPV